jgi:hypothetical protein
MMVLDEGEVLSHKNQMKIAGWDKIGCEAGELVA